MKIASIERIIKIENHPNADLLDIATVLGYQAIVKRDQYKTGYFCVFIQPDTILPDEEWAKFYKAKSSRVKAIRLRGEWSMGIIESVNILIEKSASLEIFSIEGYEVSDILNIKKYEPPLPKGMAPGGGRCNTKGLLPYGIFRTDEERWQNLKEIPYGKLCDVTLKIDGSSTTIYCKKIETILEDGTMFHEWQTGVCARNFEIKLEEDNAYIRINEKYKLIEKLEKYCKNNDCSLALRGEMYGSGIQKGEHNPHSKEPLSFALFNILDLSTLKYVGFEYFDVLSKMMDIDTVEVLEANVPLTEDLISRFDSELEYINDDSKYHPDFKGIPFEGVVVKFNDGSSFKIINKHYDSKK